MGPRQKPPQHVTERLRDELWRAFERDFGPDVRTRDGWRDEAARRIGVPKTLLTPLLAGTPRDYQLGTILKIQRYVGTSLDELLGLTTPSNAALFARRLEVLEAEMHARKRAAAPDEPKEATPEPPSVTGEFRKVLAE